MADLRTVTLAVWFVAAASACNYRAAFSDYCDDTGFCQCADGECCVIEQYRCDQFSCCEGLSCIDGRCQAGKVEFELVPAKHEFGVVRPGETRRATLALVNRAADAVLPVANITVTGAYEIVDHGCREPLAAGSSCSITVEARPVTAELSVRGTLAAVIGRVSASAQLVTQSGAELRLVAHTIAPVTTEPGGERCPPASAPVAGAYLCARTYPLDAVLTLEHAPVPAGYSPPADVNECRWIDRRCQVVVNQSRWLWVDARENILIGLRGAGRVSIGTVVCENTTPGDSWWQCKVPWVGSATFTATPGEGATGFTWSGACVNASASTCTLDVQAYTYVGATFQ